MNPKCLSIPFLQFANRHPNASQDFDTCHNTYESAYLCTHRTLLDRYTDPNGYARFVDKNNTLAEYYKEQISMAQEAAISLSKKINIQITNLTQAKADVTNVTTKYQNAMAIWAVEKAEQKLLKYQQQMANTETKEVYFKTYLDRLTDCTHANTNDFFITQIVENIESETGIPIIAVSTPEDYTTFNTPQGDETTINQCGFGYENVYFLPMLPKDNRLNKSV